MDALELKFKELNPDKVLDIATGVGNNIFMLKEVLGSYQTIIGIDTDPRLDVPFKKNFPEENITFQAMDATHMDFPDNTFDLVTISNSIHHFDNPKAILLDALRVMKPNGTIVISEMLSDKLSEAQMSHKLIHHWWAEIDTLKGVFHRDTYTEQELKDVLDTVAVQNREYFIFEYPVENPRSAELIAKYQETLTSSLERIKDLPEFAQMETKVTAINTHLAEHGFAPARTSIVFLERK